MDAKQLERMTILELREEARKFPDIQGVSGMKKEDLLRILKEKYGIKDTGPKGDLAYKQQLKAKIRKLKAERDQALQAKDATKVKQLRELIKRLKRKTRKIAEKTKATAT
jgi:cell division protein FtsX